MLIWRRGSGGCTSRGTRDGEPYISPSTAHHSLATLRRHDGWDIYLARMISLPTKRTSSRTAQPSGMWGRRAVRYREEVKRTTVEAREAIACLLGLRRALAFLVFVGRVFNNQSRLGNKNHSLICWSIWSVTIIVFIVINQKIIKSISDSSVI